MGFQLALDCVRKSTCSLGALINSIHVVRHFEPIPKSNPTRLKEKTLHQMLTTNLTMLFQFNLRKLRATKTHQYSRFSTRKKKKQTESPKKQIDDRRKNQYKTTTKNDKTKQKLSPNRNRTYKRKIVKVGKLRNTYVKKERISFRQTTKIPK